MDDQRNRETKDALFGARAFYFVFHIIGIIIILYYQTRVSEDIKNHKFIFPIYVLILLVISIYFFLTCGKNPGFAQQSPQSSLKLSENDQLDCINSIELSEQNSQNQKNIQNNENKYSNQFYNQQNNEFQQESTTYNNNRLSLEQQKGSISSNEDENIDLEQQRDQYKQPLKKNSEKSKGNSQSYKQSSQLDESELHFKIGEKNSEIQQEEIARRFYCPKCDLKQEYRTRHCDMCGKCIYKFDHHCFWIGGCVGEFNHRTFWAFLFFQSWFLLVVFKIFWNAMDNYSYRDQKTGEWRHESAYGAFAVFAFLSACFLVFTGVLCGYHTFLILTNQTTWEHASRQKITYTQIYPTGFYPFDYGIFKNIKTVFCHDNQPKKWILPTVSQAEEKMKHSFNICENQYYSCC